MGPLLVVVAHPDDEVIGMAGVILRESRAGRQVRVAIVTNGNAWGSRADGLRRNAESVAGLAVLGVPREDVIFLGYRQTVLPRLRGEPTYALGVDGGEDGDYRFVTTGRHARGTSRDLGRDLASVVGGAEEIYTHVPFDGHADHAHVANRVLAAATGAVIWGTLVHPPGAGSCLELSAGRWPAPAGDPQERFLPDAEVEAPPSPACAERPAATSWGPRGEPDVRPEVPHEMQRPDEATNLKWRAIACHESQLELGPVSAGYLRAFVRRHEFFWRLAG